MKYCSIEDCKNKVKAKELCEKHYLRQRKGLDPSAPTRFDQRPSISKGNYTLIPIGINAKDGYAIVDNDYAFLDHYKWHLLNGYPVKNRTTPGHDRMHHMIIGFPPTGLVTDHKNRNVLDNRLSNLRFITQQQNSYNQSGSKNNVTGFKGVSRNKLRYKAEIWAGGKRKHIGTYNTPEEAAIAYNEWAIKLHGEFAYLNQI